MIVIDTSAVLAVITNEPTRPRLLELTANEELLAPPTIRWELANALSAMFKRRRIDLAQGLQCLALFDQIPIRVHDVPTATILQLSAALNIYAYDACMLACAAAKAAPLLTLDGGLRDAAKRADIEVIEVRT